MSAYKDLEALLGGTPLARQVIDAALREHAYQLAEKLRKEMGAVDAYPGESEEAKRYIKGWHAAAAYIDPEVST